MAHCGEYVENYKSREWKPVQESASCDWKWSGGLLPSYQTAQNLVSPGTVFLCPWAVAYVLSGDISAAWLRTVNNLSGDAFVSVCLRALQMSVPNGRKAEKWDSKDSPFMCLTLKAFRWHQQSPLYCLRAWSEQMAALVLYNDIYHGWCMGLFDRFWLCLLNI